MMANNDQIILDNVIETERTERAPAMKSADFFETYVAEQVLKDYNLSDEDILSGVVASALDGGIDGIYTFANGELVREDFDNTTLRKNIVIEVVIIQSKTATGFSEEPLNKFIAVSGHLFSLANSVDDFKDRYNDELRSAINLFRELYTATAARFPDLHFRYIYATRGNHVHPNVHGKVNDLQKVVASFFPNAMFEFSFLGATELLALARKRQTDSFPITYDVSLTTNQGYIVLVKLKEFIKFVRDDQGRLRKALFEANVRDYQGNIQVNGDMQESLLAGGPEDFWWLNNGVTVVANRANQGGKVLTIEDPQIVNGQQTSTEIFNYFRDANTEDDERSVMLRVIITEDSAIRDRVIKATNNQTSIPLATLRATEKIHRDIEAFLAPHGIYYDRRKNSQKQAGRPVDSILSISTLAQSMMSIVLHRPDDARARPSSLIKNNDDYVRILSPSLPMGIYLVAAKMIKMARAHLRTFDQLMPKDRNNLVFYVVMHAAATLTKSAEPSAERVAGIDVSEIDESLIAASLAEVEPLYRSLGATDQISKGPQLLTALKAHLLASYPVRC